MEAPGGQWTFFRERPLGGTSTRATSYKVQRETGRQGEYWLVGHPLWSPSGWSQHALRAPSSAPRGPTCWERGSGLPAEVGSSHNAVLSPCGPPGKVPRPDMLCNIVTISLLLYISAPAPHPTQTISSVRPSSSIHALAQQVIMGCCPRC